ncbi:MAG: LytR C-terminal domain-containing protein [Microbacterium sp.]|nr:LytR C-terminal domain-containing protein [Microbacterium sp.]
MPRTTYPRDRFDDVPASRDRVGAHRAENPHMRGWIVFLWAAIATIVLIAVGIFGTLVVSGRIVLFPTPTASAAPTPTITPVVDTSYTVLVINATGVDGQATAVKDALVQAKWSADSVLASDAGSTFPTTTVYYPLPEDAPAAAGVAKLIGGAKIAQSDKCQLAGEPEAQQLAIVLGTDRVAPSPTATK